MAEMIPVRVALRIRPLSSKEIENGCDSVLDIVPGRPQITIRNSGKAFTYDNAYSTDSAQQSVYSQSVQPLIQQLFKGYNATVLAYGQTGSGKTFSMGTSNREGETPVHHEGVIPRAVRDIFDQIKDFKSDYDFCIRVAFVELYKEKLYDLLSPSSKIKEDCMVDLREDPLKGVVIANLTEVNVKDLRSTMEQLEIGSVKRVTAATAMNNTSSRSHAIFTIFIEGTRKSDSDAESKDKPDNIVAKFHLVDLAGSERAKKTMATGVRYKEGVSINLGLLALGNVISALGDESGPKTHIPYRDSKLTRLLQDSLGGNSHTLMIACVSPADTNLEETISTLRYADRARKIKNKPIVNQDGKDAENSKLRREIAELKIQLLNNGGGNSLANSKELDELKSKTATLTSENRELTSALMSCQDELSHMNEKLLLTEDSNIKLKTKLEELAAETGQLLTKTPTMKSDLEQVLGKIKQLLDVQKDHEKSLAEHDLSRFGDKSTGDFDDSPEEEICTTQILKQNALATQLASLNKQLAQKEQYALVLNDQEDKLKEVRKKYEDQFEKMESQMKSLEKEKDNLVQQSRAEPVTSKLSEQRRKRIQELESQIGDLKKKLIEQQKMIKINEKNEQKLKTLGEEIRGMKQAKVRLIQQMKKDAEKVRMWKMQKEKEVNQLKQTERKQQVKISKMTTLHTKQQNVLKRKMEEAVSANKRLKDVIDKQKAAKKIGHLGKQGLAGAAERMRNLVSQELDVVVSLKEAKQSCEQLLNDRKTLNKELADLKKKTRYTMTNDERAEMQSKIENLEGELTMRNVQIGQLQSQILDADTTDNEQNSKSSNSKWWDALQTMTEAKIALQYLFEKAAENMASLGTTQGTYNELKSLYEEAVKNTQALEDEIINLKEDHEEQMLEAGKDYEDRVAYLLNQLTNKSYKGEVSEKDIQMFSKLQENLLKMTKEFEQPNNKERKNKAKRYDVKDLIAEAEDDEDDDEFDDDDSDPDWYQTPLLKRIKKIRETGLHHAGALGTTQLKRKLGETFTENDTPEQDAEGPKPKKRSGSSILGGCACKTGCKTKRCACVKNHKTCTDACKCPLMQCENRKDRDHDHSTDQPDQSALSDISNSTAGTMSLLNDTYQIPMIKEETAERKITPPMLNFDMENAAPKKLEVKESMFKSPLSAKTPPSLLQKRTSMFPSPLRE